MNSNDEPSAAPHLTPAPAARPDPLAGQPDAHPVGVGLGALGVGALATVIGAVVGPVGAIIGAALGSVAGGLAGREASQSASDSAAADRAEEAAAHAPAAAETLHAAAVPDPDAPLPTASQGLVTPQESFFGDPAPGSGALPAESPLDGALAVNADPAPGFTVSSEAEPPEARREDPRHAVRIRAYYRYLNRQAAQQPGDEHGDWTAAEREQVR